MRPAASAEFHGVGLLARLFSVVSPLTRDRAQTTGHMRVCFSEPVGLSAPFRSSENSKAAVSMVTGHRCCLMLPKFNLETYFNTHLVCRVLLHCLLGITESCGAASI